MGLNHMELNLRYNDIGFSVFPLAKLRPTRFFHGPSVTKLGIGEEVLELAKTSGFKLHLA